jgi:hypothetical protein
MGNDNRGTDKCTNLWRWRLSQTQWRLELFQALTGNIFCFHTMTYHVAAINGTAAQVFHGLFSLNHDTTT